MIPSLEIKDFFTAGKTLDKTHVILHITEPNAPHERERGIFFALFELAKGTVGLIEICQKIIEYIEERYYSREEKSELLLEHILQAVNREYHTILNQHQTELSCLVGTIRDGEIQLSYHGKPTAVVFFHRDNQITTLPIIEEESSAELFFSEIISGTIGVRDFFYAATPHTLNYFPLDRIAKLVHDRPLREVANHIQKVLGEIGSDYSFGGLVAQVLRVRPPMSQATKEKKEHLGSEASLNHLAHAAHKTTETLSPPLFGDVKKTLQKIKDSPTWLTHLKPGLSTKSDSTKDHLLIIIGRSMVMAIGSLARICIDIGRSIFNFFFWLYRLLKNRNSRLKEINHARLKLNNYRRTIVGLPTATKAIVIGLLLIALIFLSSLAYLRVHEYETMKKTKISNSIQAIIDKKDAAEASLAYEDKTKAQILIDEAETLLAQLPNDSSAEKNKKEELNAILLSVRDKLRNEHRVIPELVANLSIVNAANRAEKLTLFDTTLIAFGPNDASWYFINIATNAVEGKQHESMNELIEASATNEGDLVIFRSQNGEIGMFDVKTQTLTKKNISFPINDVFISSMEIYNKKLYVIDSVNKKIYRHNQTQNGYDQGALWSKSGESRLGGVVSMSIDGDLYALKETGEVRKWYRGEEQAFNISPIDPVLDSAERISIPEDGEEIFILDTKHRRVAVFDKNGNFREQIVSDTFKKPTGMVVANKGKTIFILDSGSVYRINR